MALTGHRQYNTCTLTPTLVYTAGGWPWQDTDNTTLVHWHQHWSTQQVDGPDRTRTIQHLYIDTNTGLHSRWMALTGHRQYNTCTLTPTLVYTAGGWPWQDTDNTTLVHWHQHWSTQQVDGPDRTQTIQHLYTDTNTGLHTRWMGLTGHRQYNTCTLTPTLVYTPGRWPWQDTDNTTLVYWHQHWSTHQVDGPDRTQTIQHLNTDTNTGLHTRWMGLTGHRQYNTCTLTPTQVYTAGGWPWQDTDNTTPEHWHQHWSTQQVDGADRTQTIQHLNTDSNTGLHTRWMGLTGHTQYNTCTLTPTQVYTAGGWPWQDTDNTTPEHWHQHWSTHQVDGPDRTQTIQHLYTDTNTGLHSRWMALTGHRQYNTCILTPTLVYTAGGWPWQDTDNTTLVYWHQHWSTHQVDGPDRTQTIQHLYIDTNTGLHSRWVALTGHRQYNTCTLTPTLVYTAGGWPWQDTDNTTPVHWHQHRSTQQVDGPDRIQTIQHLNTDTNTGLHTRWMGLTGHRQYNTWTLTPTQVYTPGGWPWQDTDNTTLVHWHQHWSTQQVDGTDRTQIIQHLNTDTNTGLHTRWMGLTGHRQYNTWTLTPTLVYTPGGWPWQDTDNTTLVHWHQHWSTQQVDGPDRTQTIQHLYIDTNTGLHSRWMALTGHRQYNTWTLTSTQVYTPGGWAWQDTDNTTPEHWHQHWSTHQVDGPDRTQTIQHLYIDTNTGLHSRWMALTGHRQYNTCTLTPTLVYTPGGWAWQDTDNTTLVHWHQHWSTQQVDGPDRTQTIQHLYTDTNTGLHSRWMALTGHRQYNTCTLTPTLVYTAGGWPWQDTDNTTPVHWHQHWSTHQVDGPDRTQTITSTLGQQHHLPPTAKVQPPHTVCSHFTELLVLYMYQQHTSSYHYGLFTYTFVLWFWSRDYSLLWGFKIKIKCDCNNVSHQPSQQNNNKTETS